MLRPRIMPCLLVSDGGLVKTVNFKAPKYVGDPINAVRIFNEKEVDELIVLDIDASANGAEPDYEMIKKLAVECRMPLCYGGGVKSVEQARKIIGLGVEKVAISSGLFSTPNLVTDIARELGAQSVVAVLDVKKRMLGGKYEVFTHNGKTKTGVCPKEFSVELQSKGVGEIVINSIDRDGVMKGYDLDLAEEVHKRVKTPLTILGGAGSLSDLGDLIERLGLIGAAAGSLFVFKGVYKAVLINYPSAESKADLLKGTS